MPDENGRKGKHLTTEYKKRDQSDYDLIRRIDVPEDTVHYREDKLEVL